MLDNPRVVESDEQLTAVIHLTVPRADIGSVMGPAIAEVLAVIAAQGLAPGGPCFSYHSKRPTEIFDFEVGFPVGGLIAASGRVRPSRLPATRVARTLYRGGYEGLAAAWGELCAWTDAQGLGVQEALWERYFSGPESSSDPANWCTELNRPLAV